MRITNAELARRRAIANRDSRPVLTLDQRIARFEARAVALALARSEDVASAAAIRLGIPTNRVYWLKRKYLL